MNPVNNQNAHPRAPQSNAQSAYHVGNLATSDDVDKDLYEAMQKYLTEDLGIQRSSAATRSSAELTRAIPKSVLSSLAQHGISVTGLQVLDLGAGLGAMSEELILSGARLVSLEPGGAWYNLTQRRLERHAVSFHLLNAFGEAIPLPDASVDLIISLQVLEHVQDPERVLAEAFRVLRPGGYFFLACANYFAFWEQHYQLAWLPLLPKPLGSIYLRLCGRSPRFLHEAITYITYLGVLRSCRRLGFLRERDAQLSSHLKLKSGIKWRLLRALSKVTGVNFVLRLDHASNAFKMDIYELMRKPPKSLEGR